MGTEARVAKERTCRECNAKIWGTAWQLVVHADMCRRAAEVGLILPGQQPLVVEAPFEL